MDTQVEVENDIRHVAIHEAGHAVVGLALGIPVIGDASIVPDFAEMTAGYVLSEADHWRLIDLWERREKYRDENTAHRACILMLMAGAEAEIEILGTCEGGDDSDRVDVWRRIDTMNQPLMRDGSNDIGVLENRLRQRTRGLVRRHREAIERLAAALLDQKTLDPIEVERIAGITAG